jgi:hypothetical protein
LLGNARLPDTQSAKWTSAAKTATSSPSPTHPRAGLSHAQWRALGPAEKIERLFSMSLDDLYEVMSWPIGKLDPFRLSVRTQVTRVVFTICLKAFLDASSAAKLLAS